MTDAAGFAATADVLTRDPRGGAPDAAAAHLQHDQAHGVCANCETRLIGPHCHACGQKAHLHSRLRDLLHEALEGIAHFDGRLWRTLPLLAFNPGRLSREWRAGRRARYIAPLHLFLFAVFLFFTVPTLTGRHLVNLPNVNQTNAAASEARRTAEEAARDARTADALRQMSADGEQARPGGAREFSRNAGQFLRSRFENREYYQYKIETLSYKLSFLLVPISMLILALLLAFKRGYSFYDHGVVSLYGVGFVALALTVFSLLDLAAGAFGFRLLYGGWLGLGFAIHAILHLKGAYALSWTGAILRGLMLGLLSSIGFGLFIAGVFALGFAS